MSNWIGPNAGPVFFSLGVVGLFFAYVYRRQLGSILAAILGESPADGAVPSQEGAALLSSAGEDTALQRRLSLQTDSQTAETDETDSEEIAINEAARRAALLDLYRLLRAHEIGREAARPILKALGLPLNNNDWTAAKPVKVSAPAEADTPVAVTPVAERPYDPTRYHPDRPDLQYRPLDTEAM